MKCWNICDNSYQCIDYGRVGDIKKKGKGRGRFLQGNEIIKKNIGGIREELGRIYNMGGKIRRNNTMIKDRSEEK